MKSIKWMVASALVLFGSATMSKQANAQDAYVGEIRMFAGDFAPRGWEFCNGQIMSIAQNTALFSILKTTYGGNGNTTFALPDLRGRAPIHQGQGPELANKPLGEKSGEQTTKTSLISTEQKVLVLKAGVEPKADAPFVERGIAIPKPDQVISNNPPVLSINFIICTQGIFPNRP